MELLLFLAVVVLLGKLMEVEKLKVRRCWTCNTRFLENRARTPFCSKGCEKAYPEIWEVKRAAFLVRHTGGNSGR